MTCIYCGEEVSGRTVDCCFGCLSLLETPHGELVRMYRDLEARVA